MILGEEINKLLNNYPKYEFNNLPLKQEGQLIQ